MPLHFYAPERTPCKLCGDGFEHHSAASVPALTACPTCGASVIRRPAQSTCSPKLSAPLSVSRAKQSGFFFYQRTHDGTFEKSN
ncbi:MAG TPA: zinc ribbon domain-containing protein [Opitutus sp.]|nr:zinc ribbon domain-containing protein [Opitutus sp.]